MAALGGLFPTATGHSDSCAEQNHGHDTELTGDLRTKASETR